MKCREVESEVTLHQQQQKRCKVMANETEKEKTKMRERQRRSITTKILTGLRKHGNYNLPPRADINDVIRALATEAGWIVEADGTTYRNPLMLRCNSNGVNFPALVKLGTSGKSMSSPVSMSPISLTPPTLSASSFDGIGSLDTVFPMMNSDAGELKCGDGSTTSSPRHASSSLMSAMHTNTGSVAGEGVCGGPQLGNPSLFGSIPSGYILDETTTLTFTDDTFMSADIRDLHHVGHYTPTATTTTSCLAGQSAHHPLPLATLHQHDSSTTLPSVLMFSQHHFLQECRASNQNTPIGSPQPYGGNCSYSEYPEI